MRPAKFHLKLGLQIILRAPPITKPKEKNHQSVQLPNAHLAFNLPKHAIVDLGVRKGVREKLVSCTKNTDIHVKSKPMYINHHFLPPQTFEHI